MPFLFASTLICVLFTVLARLGWPHHRFLHYRQRRHQAGLQFYDALLTEVSTEGNRGRIGGIGVGWVISVRSSRSDSASSVPATSLRCSCGSA